MGSMHTGLEEEKNGFERMAAYFAERAKGGVGLIVTGGISPNRAGWVGPFSARMTNSRHAKQHQEITKAVHEHGSKICMQILHSGRYGYHPLCVAPSKIKAPISKFKPKALSGRGVEKTIADFVRCALLAREAGYDGVEIMGSEGYLINQFIVSKTNHRTDKWGGSYENRIQFPIEIVKRIREEVGSDFIIIYRLSMLDLVEDGSSWEEVELLAQEIEKAGATIINTGIGWHEARIPTIATMVPRGGFAWVTKRLMGKVSIPLITTNRINTPELAENILEEGCSDMISMARPFLADPDFMNKAKENRADEINTCIACNQACLDHIFKRKTAACLVNPRACHETELTITPTTEKKKVAVVGAGPAGLSAAVTAAEKGHYVVLFEAKSAVGGQFNLAKRIPGKFDFHETLRYYSKQLEKLGVTVKLETKFRAEEAAEFDHVILAAGVKPRKINLPGIDNEKVILYDKLISQNLPVGDRVAIIGAGGIGFDVAEFLLHGVSEELETAEFMQQWGVDQSLSHRGGLVPPEKQHSQKTIYLLQRKTGKLGVGLGKTTGWIHRATLKKAGVQMIGGVSYEAVTDSGIEISINGKSKLLEVDNIIVCAGQVKNDVLAAELSVLGVDYQVIGGAKLASELDAKRAISDGFTSACAI